MEYPNEGATLMRCGGMLWLYSVRGKYKQQCYKTDLVNGGILFAQIQECAVKECLDFYITIETGYFEMAELRFKEFC